MSPRGIAYSIVLGLGVAGTAVLWVGHLRLEELRGELERRRETEARATRAVRKTEAPQMVAGAPARPAPAAAPAKRSPSQSDAAARPPERPAAPAPQLRVPASAWSQRKAVTTTACFEGVVLASVTGDVERLGGLLTCDVPMRQALEDAHGKMPESLRAAHPSVEHLLASMVSVQVPANLSAYGVLGERPLGETESIMAVRLERGNAHKPSDATFVFRKDGDVWRLVVPPPIVSEFLRNIGAPSGK